MESLLWLALSNAILATLLAVLGAVIACFCRRPTVRHALWLLVFLKLITPPLMPLSVTWPRSEESKPPPAVLLLPEPGPSEAIPSLPESTPTIGAATVRERPDPPLPYGRGSVFSLALVIVWLGGALAWWSVAAVRVRRFQRWLRQARPAPPDVQEQARRLAVLLRLRRCPPVAFVSAPLSPMLWALGLSPLLLLPSELWPRLEKEQQDTLLAHELAHLRRGDHWVRRLEFVVLGLYWWQPVVWWARRRLQEAEEECCDGIVIAVLPDAASAYASALVETVAFLSQSRPSAIVGASGAGQVPLLKRRLIMILKDTSSRKPSRVGFWIVLGLGALLLPLAPRAARTESPKEPQRVEATDRVADPVAAGLRWLANPHVVKALNMANCATCHEAQKVNPHDLQHPWKEIHDELLRVMAEYTSELRKIDRPAPAAAEPVLSQEIEKLQDEIELLRLQVRLKEARLRGARTSLPLARKRLEWSQRLRKGGSISEEEMMKAEAAVTTSETDIEVKEVELEEARLLLKQAERRLARLQRPAEKTDGGHAKQEKRFRELEQKVENLLKEIHKMRKDMQPDKPRDQGLVPKEVREFIDRVWPTLDTARLGVNISKAQAAFQICKNVGDRISLEKLLKGTERHADRLAKELALLHPDLVIEDQIPALNLKKFRELIIKLCLDIEDYLKAHDAK
jgi:beta-lactamase regulating signal transducer with metallopeptidase domain